MKTSQIRKNDKLMGMLKSVAGGRDIKTHNYDGGYNDISVEDAKGLHYSLLDLYKNPSQYKIDIDNHIRMTVNDVFNIIRPWTYRGNCMSFSMDIAIEFEGEKYCLTFTKDNLHIVGFDY